ncbi:MULTISPECIES: helix-turn-helix domain-containing protein [Hyphomonas]|uniref:DNA-binding protein n=1 Tax=Hyphomonas adhaerens TaxID=81029 RepID=A0A3B9H0K7_9PROT|nr:MULTISPECIES: helix-turn-helix transcriptional regulator [Hyphomonas]MBB39191.1 DNA-binding protein [Hyphomonas sp.]HAE28237.1 DNA-binding protein [Hyphomonas adhaerens]
MSDSKLPSGIDRVVGQRIRWRRRELKLSQEQLAELLSLTFQQVQKYEKGVNRVSAGRLFEIASVMGVQVNYFYDGAESQLEDSRPYRFAEGGGANEGPRAPVLDAETLDLIAAFQKIKDDSLRKSLLNTVRAAASAFESKQSED